MLPSCRSADVVVVGAGVIGLATALELQLAGLRVRVLERGAVGRGSASWAGGGILSPLEPGGIEPEAMPLLRDSLAMYAGWCRSLHEASGIDPEYLESGLRVLNPHDTPGWEALARDCGWRVQIRDADGGLLGDAKGSLWLPQVAQVRSPRLLRALVGAFRDAGGELLEGESASMLLCKGDRVVGVRTARDAHAAAQVVLAAGAWSSSLAPECAVRPIRGQMLLLDACPGELDAVVLQEGRYLIPRKDGPVVAGSTLEDEGLDDRITEDGRREILRSVERMAPALAQRRVLAQWSGLRPGAQRPQVGPSESRRCLYLNVGHHRLGITLAPGSARALCRTVLADSE